ncbi:MAG: hypothetical protein F6J93_21240 [Oscillatoria sp. SIO1A7]|nr:hypothetical protein [Oscillatoria sp. SIO1A7]
MEPQIMLLPFGLPEMLAQVTETGRITIADRYGLMAAVLDESLGEEYRSCIDRMLHALHRGRLKMVDEISTVAGF